MPFPLPPARFLAALTACLLPSLSTFAAEISGGSAEVGTLKPAERIAGPALAPASDESLKLAKGFQLPSGFTTSIWASEPLLGNPVAISIDEQGRIFVAETFRLRTSTLDIRHYMFMLEDDLACRTTDDRIASTKKNFPNDWQKLEIESERIQLLQDTDGDGKADKSSVYAEDMHTMLDGLNSGVLAYQGKVWCTAIPNVWLFSGLTKNGQAEKRESLSFGYGVRFSFTGHDLHGLILGPDGRLYFSFGDRGAYVKTKEGKTLAFSDEGAVFRCEPDGSHLEAIYRGLRNPEELGFDNHGNLFTGDNDCDQGDRERWVYLVEGGDSGWRVGWQYPQLGVPHNMWMSEHMWEPRTKDTPYYLLSPILNITDGPSGVAHNPGTGLPPEYDDMFFVCSFKGTSATSGIASWKVREDGAGFVTDKTPATFVGHVQATDLEFGPDSRLYFTDWGEGWASSGRGRIYRMENAAERKTQAAQIAEVQALIGGELLKKSSAEFAKLLGHPDQRIRLRAQWALAEKRDAVTRFTAVLKSDENELARLHAIWGLGQVARHLKEDRLVWPLKDLLHDKSAEVRAQAFKVLGEHYGFAAFEDEFFAGLKDESTRVRFFAAMGMFSRPSKPAQIDALFALARENADKDEFIRHAVVYSLERTHDLSALAQFAQDPSRAVRLAVLLTYRRLEKPEVAQFLNDADPLLVLEAARAINDEGIAAAYGDLAKLIAKPTPDEHLMLRVLNANFRAGTPETALALAGYAANDAQPEFLRTEALNLLALWAKPPQRDRIAGVFRPLKERDTTPAAKAVKAVLAPLTFVEKSEGVALAAVQAVQTLAIKDEETAKVLVALMAQTQIPAKVRMEALKTLAAFNDSKLLDAIKSAVADKDPGLRIEASAMLGKLDPAEAAKQLAAAFGEAAKTEQKQILDALGDLPGAAADDALAGLLGDPAKVLAEAKLELIEAAGKRKSPDVKAKLAAYLAAGPGKDPLLAKYSFAMAGGNADNGERLFTEHPAAQCTRCHRVHGAGGEAGPDLSTVAAKKDRRYILESIVDPNAQIAEGFQTIMVTLTNGDIKAGIVKAETADTVTLQMPAPGAAPETVKKAEIKARENAPSGMPPGLGDLLSRRDLRDIVEYVAGLK